MSLIHHLHVALGIGIASLLHLVVGTLGWRRYLASAGHMEERGRSSLLAVRVGWLKSKRTWRKYLLPLDISGELGDQRCCGRVVWLKVEGKDAAMWWSSI